MVGKKTILLLVLFTIALTARFLYLFIFSDPEYAGLGNYDDTYYYWDIAYASKENGFPEKTLKLSSISFWDPYFWGLVHPILTTTLFKLTKSSDIGIMRSMTSLFGSLSVIIVFLLCWRYWNIKVGFAASVFAALNPVGIFTDSSGMTEPIGIFFLLTAIYFWPRKPVLTGVGLASALMTRPEYWIVSILMVLIILVTSAESFKNKIYLLIGYTLPVGLYSVYLYKYTGSPISPFYKNFVTNLQGGGMVYPDSPDVLSRVIFLGIFVVGLISFLITSSGKMKGRFLLILGSLNLIYLGIVFGLSNYSKSLTPDVWHHRYVELMFIFVGIISAVFLFYGDSRIGNLYAALKNPQPLILFIFTLGAVQTLWFSISKTYVKNKPEWNNYKIVSSEISSYYNGGDVVIAHDLLHGSSLYALYKYGKIPGKNILSEMLDPYFTMEDDPYVKWHSYAGLFLKWIKEKNIKIIITYEGSDRRYSKLAQDMPYALTGPKHIPNSDLVIYKITD